MAIPYANLQVVAASADTTAESGGSFNASWRIETPASAAPSRGASTADSSEAKAVMTITPRSG
jgi:hypothetical protein